jgi:hypothetical protein
MVLHLVRKAFPVLRIETAVMQALIVDEPHLVPKGLHPFPHPIPLRTKDGRLVTRFIIINIRFNKKVSVEDDKKKMTCEPTTVCMSFFLRDYDFLHFIQWIQTNPFDFA